MNIGDRVYFWQRHIDDTHWYSGWPTYTLRVGCLVAIDACNKATIATDGFFAQKLHLGFTPFLRQIDAIEWLLELWKKDLKTKDDFTYFISAEC